MPYVKRDAEGRIMALYQDAVEDGLESVSVQDADVQAFISRFTDGGGPGSHWLYSDLQMVRVLEDLIDALIKRAVIGFDDLPPDARTKIIQRRRRRADLGYVQSLADDDDGGGYL